MGMRQKNGTLTAREKIAADHYVTHGHMGDAFAAAGYSTRGKQWRRKCSEVFDRPQVREYIAKLQQQATEHAVMDRAEAERILERMARADMSDVLTPAGNVDITKLQKHGNLILSSVSHVTGKYGDSVKFQIPNQIQAIERLAKLRGWDQPDRLAVEGLQINLNIPPRKTAHTKTKGETEK